MRTFIFALCVVTYPCVFGLVGCAKSQPDAASNKSAATHDHDAHAHSDEGPHGGHIIELGTEEHHAELTHDDEAHRIGIHLLGSDAKTAAPIDAESVTINVSVDGKLQQYTLPAAPQEGESPGGASYFELVSEPLCDIVCGESESSTHPRVSIQIDGKSYVGMIETGEHEHEHGHDHDH